MDRHRMEATVACAANRMERLFLLEVSTQAGQRIPVRSFESSPITWFMPEGRNP
jgi:hypothetical protein